MTTSPTELAEARAEIMALLAECTFRIDNGECIADLFQESSVFSMPRGETRGRTAIAKLFASIHESRKAEAHVARHGSVNVRVVSLGPNRFEVRYLMIAFALAAPTALTGSLFLGDQVDIVERDSEGVYRFVQRTLRPALEFSLTPKLERGS